MSPVSVLICPPFPSLSRKLVVYASTQLDSVRTDRRGSAGRPGRRRHVLLQHGPLHGINLDLTADPVQTFVWTGTNPTGTGFGGPLGSLPTPQVGSTTDTNSDWIASGRSNIPDVRPFYGISSVLSVPQTVPEPSSLTMLGTALSVCLAIG